MPKPRTAKTKWALSLLVATCLLLAGAVVLQTRSQPASEARMVVNGHRYNLDIVRTAADQAKGLGGRDQLAADAGMLFVFPLQSRQCFWMKDMQFPIDMVWVDTYKQVTAIEQNVSPDTYPRSFCHDGQYVVELAAGQAAAARMHAGSVLSL